MKIVDGDLIDLTYKGYFDVIAHGCNCFCTQGAGVAVAMVDNFNTNNPAVYLMEHPKYSGEINKLGCIEVAEKKIKVHPSYLSFNLDVINCYTQYHPGKKKDKKGNILPGVEYPALALCMRKINHLYEGKRVGLPKIGCGIAGGDWDVVKAILEQELTDVELTVVNYVRN